MWVRGEGQYTDVGEFIRVGRGDCREIHKNVFSLCDSVSVSALQILNFTMHYQRFLGHKDLMRFSLRSEVILKKSSNLYCLLDLGVC